MLEGMQELKYSIDEELKSHSVQTTQSIFTTMGDCKSKLYDMLKDGLNKDTSGMFSKILLGI